MGMRIAKNYGRRSRGRGAKTNLTPRPRPSFMEEAEGKNVRTPTHLLRECELSFVNRHLISSHMSPHLPII